MSKIDLHCHVFNKDVLTFGGKILADLGDVITDLINNGDYNNAETKIERINAFIEISKKDSTKIAKALYKSYGDESIIVPLMYDMYYLTHDLEKDFKEHLDRFLHHFDAQDHKDGDRAKAIRGKVKSIGDDVLKDLADKAIDRDSFEIQVQDMKKLKRHFKDRIYPFMSFDPRDRKSVV